MITKLKENFKQFKNFDKFLKLKKTGHKLYINTDVIKQNYKFGNYIFGYDYSISLIDFNTLCVKFILLDKKNNEYVILLKYYNLLNFVLLFIN